MTLLPLDTNNDIIKVLKSERSNKGSVEGGDEMCSSKTTVDLKAQATTIFERIQSLVSLVSPVESPRLQVNREWKQAVGQFKIVALPEWRFGVQIDLESNEFAIFGEHSWLIDKFKPSSCYVSYEALSVWALEVQLHRFLKEVEDIIQHPIRHFGYSLYYGDEISDAKAQEEYETMKWERRFEKKLDRRARETIFDLFKTLPTYHSSIVAAGLLDRHLQVKGCRIYPRYEARVVVKPETPEAIVDLLYQMIETLSNSKGFKSRHEQFRFDGIYDDLSDLQDYHYLFQQEGMD